MSAKGRLIPNIEYSKSIGGQCCCEHGVGYVGPVEKCTPPVDPTAKFDWLTNDNRWNFWPSAGSDSTDPQTTTGQPKLTCQRTPNDAMLMRKAKANWRTKINLDDPPIATVKPGLLTNDNQWKFWPSAGSESADRPTPTALRLPTLQMMRLSHVVVKYTV